MDQIPVACVYSPVMCLEHDIQSQIFLKNSYIMVFLFVNQFSVSWRNLLFMLSVVGNTGLKIKISSTSSDFILFVSSQRNAANQQMPIDKISSAANDFTFRATKCFGSFSLFPSLLLFLCCRIWRLSG